MEHHNQLDREGAANVNDKYAEAYRVYKRRRNRLKRNNGRITAVCTAVSNVEQKHCNGFGYLESIFHMERIDLKGSRL
jgi:hypothetical protein